MTVAKILNLNFISPCYAGNRNKYSQVKDERQSLKRVRF